MADPTTDDVTALARLIWHTSRADESTISATGANIVAAAVLASSWLAERDARVQAEALRGAANEYGPAQITYMGSADGYVKVWLKHRADRIERRRGESL